MQFVRLNPPDRCRHFDRALERDLSDVVYQIDAASACRTGAGNEVRRIGDGVRHLRSCRHREAVSLWSNYFQCAAGLGR